MGGWEDRNSGDAHDESRDYVPSGAPAAGWAVPNRFTADEIFERVLTSADEEIAASKRQLFVSRREPVSVAEDPDLLRWIIGEGIGSEKEERVRVVLQVREGSIGSSVDSCVVV